MDNKLFDTPKEADDYIWKHFGGSKYLNIVKVNCQTKLQNFGD